MARAVQQSGQLISIILDSLPLTCHLEGTNRPNRGRERKALCYRHPHTLYVLRGLLVPLHHTVGRGQGNMYTRLNCPRPRPQDNPFDNFPARKMPLSPLQTDCGTPLKLKTFKYGQQRSYELPAPLIPSWSVHRPISPPPLSYLVITS